MINKRKRKIFNFWWLQVLCFFRICYDTHICLAWYLHLPLLTAAIQHNKRTIGNFLYFFQYQRLMLTILKLGQEFDGEAKLKFWKNLAVQMLESNIDNKLFHGSPKKARSTAAKVLSLEEEVTMKSWIVLILQMSGSEIIEKDQRNVSQDPWELMQDLLQM